ncbi:hypothetical protein Y032_0002g1146 [Ancylostoma ceylanicum]|uniref:Uncharacterized protein n=1 Tax=Ancylostoma ceylanicum TaxID=53326 RepID=A0A016W1I8_9BILA|nr:hypothetical protein Y032_0002g1146 [Ancylostoma ceylanicum]
MITPILPPTHRLDRSAAIPFWKKKWLSTIFLSAISVIDIRLPPTTNFKEMDELIDSWCKKAGPGVTYKFLVKTEIPVMTPTTSDDPFWAAFEKSLQDEGYKTVCRTGGVAFGSCRKMGVAYLNIRNEHDETHCSKIKS